MIRLYTYVMTHDTGFAPNPFWGYCTLATCTPNHQGSRAEAGDWIAGVSERSRGHQLIYAMEVEERLCMDAYFRDRRFAKKRPRRNGESKDRCGDNFYSLKPNGQWKQHWNAYHGPDACQKDTRCPYVFIGRRFWYRGRDAVTIPARFKPMFGGRGARVTHPQGEVDAFRKWVVSSLKEGVAAMPRDFELGARQPTADRRRC